MHAWPILGHSVYITIGNWIRKFELLTQFNVIIYVMGLWHRVECLKTFMQDFGDLKTDKQVSNLQALLKSMML